MSRYYKTTENRVFDGVVNLVMILTLLICFLPFVYMAALSFSSSKAILNNQVSFWRWASIWTLTSRSSPTRTSSRPTAIRFPLYTICGTAIAMLMTIMFAYPLSKDYLLGHKFFMKLVVISMFFAGGMIPNYLLVSSLHLTGTRWAMLLPFCISQFNLIIMVNAFKGLPHELEEAASLMALATGASCAASLCRCLRRPSLRWVCTTRSSSGTTGSTL